MMQKSDMMQDDGMMQGMMNQNMPMEKYGMMVNQLPNMQQQLWLTNNQVNNSSTCKPALKKSKLIFN